MIIMKPQPTPHYNGDRVNFTLQPMIKRVELEHINFKVEEYAQSIIFMLNTLNLTLIKESSYIDVQYIRKTNTLIMIAWGVICDNNKSNLLSDYLTPIIPNNERSIATNEYRAVLRTSKQRLMYKC